MSAGHELALDLEVLGPILSQATGKPKFGLDATQARIHGKPILPGSHVKGQLRHIFEQASATSVPDIDETWIARWFGKPSARAGEPEESGFKPECGLLAITDLAADSSEDGAITRIAIDENRGSVRQGMMQVVEAPWTYGQKAVFRGKIRVQGNTDEKERDDLRNSLAWAFQLIPAVGAFKTAGFGRLEGATFGDAWKELPALETTVDPDVVKARGVDLQLVPDAPFLVWSSLHSGNFFAGDTTIPGQVLKAVAARWLADRNLLTPDNGSLLARLIFRHAHPVPCTEPNTPRPVAMPLSIYKFDDGTNQEFFDALERPHDLPIDAAFGTITFAPDWKEQPKELAVYWPRAEPCRDSRTRTKVKDGLAEDEQLFTQAAVDPIGCVWRAQVLIPPDADAKEQEAMAGLLAALDGTSLGLGKTKAALDWKPEPLKEKPTAKKHESGWRVVLQTLTCMHGPHGTRSKDPDPATALRTDYQAYWSHALGGDGCLVDFMARQRLAGGYLARRYPVSAGYEPYLLTEPGSIFLVEAVAGKECDLAERLAALAVTGLPLGSGWQEGRDDWKHHPFRPEAGWGEVLISGEPPVPKGES